MKSTGTRARGRRALAWLAIGAYWLALGAVGWKLKGEAFSDFDQYYAGITGWLWHDRSPYDLAPAAGYIYPPLLLLLLAPVLDAVDYETAVKLWFASNLLLIALSVMFVERTIGARKGGRTTWWLAALFLPLLESLLVGQVTILMLALCAGAWAAYRSGRKTLAGVLVATAAWIKLYPGLLMVYFAWKRDLRATLAAGLSAVVLALVQIAAVGWDVFLEFFRDVMPNLAGHGQFPYYNLSLLGFFHRLATDSPHEHQTPQLGAGLDAVRLIATLALLAAAAVWTRGRASDTSRERFDAEYSLVLATALLVTPTLWLSGLAPLWLGYAVAIALVRGTPHASWLVWALGLSLVLIDLSLLPYYATFEVPWALLSAGMLGTLLLWAVLAFEIQARRSVPGPDISAGA